MAVFIMMVGLPASGKSSIAAQLATTLNACVFSSDEYRARLGSGEDDQSVTTAAFAQMNADMLIALNSGETVIYDATNLSSKLRRRTLNMLPTGTYKKCILVLKPYEQCLTDNATRQRVVPEYAMARMYRSFEVPYKEEGWDTIEPMYVVDRFSYGMPESFIADHAAFDQHNSHHTLTLGEHCRRVADAVRDEGIKELSIAALIHDCGKPFCQTFKDSRGNETDEAHYYGHENVGAYNSFFYDFAGNRLMVAFLINYHMFPFAWQHESTANKYLKLWGETKFELIQLLHEADMKAK